MCKKYELARLTMSDLVFRPIMANVPDLEWSKSGVGQDNNPDQIMKHWKAYGAAALNAIIGLSSDEPQVTTNLMLACPEKSEMVGLQHRLKSPTSLARKVARKAKVQNSTPSNAVRQVDDVLRYTLCVADPQEFATELQQLLDTLHSRNYKLLKIENSFLRGNTYMGFHVNLASPEGYAL